MKFLRANGISEKEYNVNAPKVQDMQADNYGGNPAPFRYNVTTVVVVTSEQVEKVNKLMNKQTELMSQGIAIVAGDYNYQTLYEFTGLNEIKPDMVADATKNARKAAQKFAQDRDQYTPYIKNVRVVSTIEYYLKD